MIGLIPQERRKIWKLIQGQGRIPLLIKTSTRYMIVIMLSYLNRCMQADKEDATSDQEEHLEHDIERSDGDADLFHSTRRAKVKIDFRA